MPTRHHHGASFERRAIGVGRDGDSRGGDRLVGQTPVDGETPPTIGVVVVESNGDPGLAFGERILGLDPVGHHVSNECRDIG